MSIEQEFEALRKSVNKQNKAMQARFLRKNRDLDQVIRRKGILIDYFGEDDHLYITLGEPREGIALFDGSIIVIADPETLDWLSVEVLDFKKKIASGTLSGAWKQLARWLDWQPVFHIPPTKDGAWGPAAATDLPHDLAQVVRRELAAA